MEILTRRDAHARGMVRYWTGKPCRRGHLAHRYVTSGICTACIAERNGSYHRRHATLRRLVADLHPDDYEAAKALVDALVAARFHAASVTAETRRAAIIERVMEPGATICDRCGAGSNVTGPCWTEGCKGTLKPIGA